MDKSFSVDDVKTNKISNDCELYGGAIMGGAMLGGCRGCPMCGGLITPSDIYEEASLAPDKLKISDVKSAIKYYKEQVKIDKLAKRPDAVKLSQSYIRSLNNILKNLQEGSKYTKATTKPKKGQTVEDTIEYYKKARKRTKRACTLDEYQKLTTRQKQAAYARACKKKNAEAFLGAWQELEGTKPTKRVKKVKVPPQIEEILEEIPITTTTVTPTKKKVGKKKIPCTEEDYLKASLRTQKRMIDPARCGSDPAFLQFMTANLKKK